MADDFCWPHAPPHFTEEFGVYMLTAGTCGKEAFFGSRKRLAFFQGQLLELADRYGWTLQAWAVLSNHYHFVGVSPEEGAGNLSRFLGHLHSVTARFVNDLDGETGRKVWMNYWESRITHDTSHYARLNYVNSNAVHHGLVTKAVDYPWCSARWFERVSSVSFVKVVESFKTDHLRVVDDF